jgi:hypothetical protein
MAASDIPWEFGDCCALFPGDAACTAPFEKCDSSADASSSVALDRDEQFFCLGYCSRDPSQSWCELEAALDECLEASPSEGGAGYGECCSTRPAALTCRYALALCSEAAASGGLADDPELDYVCRGYCSALRPRPGWCPGLPRTLPADRTRTPYASPVATGSRQATPHPLRTARPLQTPTAEEGKESRIYVPPDEPVTLLPNLGNVGNYAAETENGQDAPMRYATVTIPKSEGVVSTIRVRDLQVDALLTIDEGIILEPARVEADERASLRIAPSAELNLRAATVERLPQVNLGETRGEYDVVPRAIRLDVPGTADKSLEYPIVRGTPFDRCKEWAAKVEGVPNGLQATCEAIGGRSRRILADVGEIGLFLRAVSEDKGIPWMYVGIAAGALVVVIVVIVVICRCRSRGKGKKHKKGKKGSSDSYSYSYSYSYSR